MNRYDDTPSIIDREITSLRGGQRLSYRDLTGGEKCDYLYGTLTTKSEFIASKYGDYRLFFKHNDAFLRAELR